MPDNYETFAIDAKFGVIILYQCVFTWSIIYRNIHSKFPQYIFHPWKDHVGKWLSINTDLDMETYELFCNVKLILSVYGKDRIFYVHHVSFNGIVELLHTICFSWNAYQNPTPVSNSIYKTRTCSPLDFPGVPIYWRGLNVIPIWISNYISHKVLYEITYLFPKFVNWYKISSTLLLGVWLLIHAKIKVNPC